MIYRNNIIKLYHKIELVISTFWWNPGPQQILHLCLNQLYNTSFYLVFSWVAKLDFEYIFTGLLIFTCIFTISLLEGNTLFLFLFF